MRGGRLDNGEISDHVHEIALQKLRADQAQTQSQQQENDKQVVGRVQDFKNRNANAAVTDLSAADYAYLKSRGLDKNADAILSGNSAQDDPKLFNELHRLSQDDPVKFAKANLLASSGQLSKAHYDYLQKVQEAINSQDLQAIQANKQVNDAVQTAHSEMLLSGVKLNADPGSEDERKLAGFETGLRDQIIAAQQARNGTPLTRDEVQNLAMGYFADQVLKGRMFGRNGVDKPQAQGAQQKGEPGTQAQEGQSQSTFSPPNIMAYGAPVASGTMAEHRAQDAKVLAPKLAVGEKMSHGVIAEGSEPGRRVYEVKLRGKKAAIDLNTICAETGYDYDQLKALNNIDHDGVWKISNGTKIILPQQSVDDQPDPNHKPVIDVDKSVAELHRNALGEAIHKCSHYVFQAINAGRPADSQVIGPGLAKDAESALRSAGFKKVVTSSDQLGSFTPRKGDVVVLQDYPGQKSAAGHIAMFDGEHWVSDYVQSGTSRIWADRKFEEAKVGMAIYRP